MKTLLYSQIRDIAEKVRTNPAICFWDEDEDGNLQDLGEEHIVRYLNDFLPSVGIYSLPDQESKGVPHHQLVYFFENRVEVINEQQFETVIRKVLEESGYKNVYQKIHFKKGQFFGKNVLTSVPYLEGKEVLRDSKNSSHRFFANGYIEITSDKVTEAIPYNALPDGKFVWNDSISVRHYRASEETLGSHHFRSFVANLSRDANGDIDQRSFERLQVVIGYLCHRYHRESQRKCVILIDRLDDENLIGGSHGGTGKSLLIRCLSEVLHTINLDGKAFKRSTQDRFALAGVNETHELVNFDDASENFTFDDIFPHITGDFHIRRLRQNPTSIPGHRAPKIVITTNHPIPGSDTSHRRRQVLVEVSSFYRELLEKDGTTPADVHGGMELCSADWSDSDWSEFYQFIFECIQVYLKQGLPKFDEESEIHKRVNLIRRCGRKDLLETLLGVLQEAAEGGEEVFCEQFYALIRERVPGARQTDSVLLGLLKEIAEENGYLFNPHKNGLIDKQRLSGERWNRWVALGLDQSTKKSGGSYQKDDRVTVFRVSKDGGAVEKNALELLMEQS
ncbi:hypothetical protein KBY83_14870 [Cyanobium sp. WKJ7-Wakatipu]|uniref:primase-helicase family protein n=1 Tax=Cyanobium sp. WKJ7-Wakatipu TaxID=2823726 RepID=UPI0020CC5E98|nr:primase-helicase family protein [Cyanobium sp. WKJ7-Wakatipu]MCP9784575.1 hypothetical protein [Cyanobium sp. WKJ7-Wakatipu]